MTRIVVATRSAHKLREIREILGGLPGLELVDLDQAGVPASPEEEHIEVYESFEENALAKARHFAERVAGPVIADDSGLCVDALGGAPGVRSKRFAGRTDLAGEPLDQANNEHLLEQLRGVPDRRRTARYVCAAVLVGAHREPVVCRGTCEGRILHQRRGSGGFGYDPLFLVQGEDRTFAQLDRAAKNQISHRARAFRELASELPGGVDEAAG